MRSIHHGSASIALTKALTIALSIAPRSALAIVSAIALTPGASAAQAASPLDAVARAMGGKDRVLAVRTLVLEGTGDVLNFGQNHTPYAENRFEVTSFRRSFDFASRRWFLDQTRVPRFQTANTNPQRQRFGLDGYPNSVAYNVAPNGNMVRAGAPVAADRLNEFLYHPVGFLMAGFADGTEVSVEPAPNNLRRIRITLVGLTFAMLVDGATMLPARIEKIVHHPMLGDVTLATELSDWREVDGLRLPMRITQRIADRWTLSDYRVTTAAVNADVGNIAATDSIRAVTLQAGGGPPAPNVVVDTIAPGVWSIAGQSHHTIAIEQSRGIVLVEAPQSDTRSLAAIARARELRPEKPLTLLINTHHHFDHAGGVRAAISQGLTIVTHRDNRDFYERFVFPGRYSSQPDALSRNPKQLTLVAVNDSYVIRDSARTVEVYAVDGSAHSGSILVVYLPAERILIQADLYNPPAPTAVNPVFPFAANLLENIQRRGLRVDRIAGIHGRPVPFSELQAAASRAP